MPALPFQRGMQWRIHVFRSLIRNHSAASRATSPNKTQLLQNPAITRSLTNYQRSFTMSAPAPGEGQTNNYRGRGRGRGYHRGASRYRPGMNDVASRTADPQRATLASRLAPALDTPIVSSSAPTPQAGVTPLGSRPTSPSFKANFSSVRFEDFVNDGQISKEQHKNIPFEFATEVQAKTLGHILAGKDV